MIFKGSKSTESLTIALNLYDQLSIQVGQFNLCFRQIVLPAILTYTISVKILGTYLTLRLSANFFENLGNFLWPVLAWESFLVILGLGTTAGLINKASKQIVVKMKCALFDVIVQNGGLRKDSRYLRRMISGSRPMKIRFGSNFVEILTPFVMTCFGIKSLVRLLLLF